MRLQGAFQKDLNLDNPLGADGAMARAYAAFMHDMWSSHGPGAVTPRALKNVIARTNPDFAGVQQHDAQELLTFLLDYLHEDANRSVAARTGIRVHAYARVEVPTLPLCSVRATTAEQRFI